MECHRSFVHVDDQRHLDTLGQSTVHPSEKYANASQTCQKHGSHFGSQKLTPKTGVANIGSVYSKEANSLVLRRLATTISVVGKQLPKVESQIHHLRKNTKYTLHLSEITLAHLLLHFCD
jgi:protein-arginine kinase activator protein McsA